MTAEEILAVPDLVLPAGFVLGAGTSAYQVEGAVDEDGRLPSIWDTFSHTPGKVLGGDNGDVACDHYHRYREDVALMAEVGLAAYRFSVSWARVIPDGSTVNRQGLDFYRRLVDELLDAGIEPWPTLYHWDLPQAVEDSGGWRARDTAERFADYAAVVHAALGDRVPRWTTINEPWCAAFLGYCSGEHAPGAHDPAGSLVAVHHLLLAHGLGAQAIRANDPKALLGITVNLYPVSPATDAPADLDAARRIDGLQNRLFLDPLLLGRYPVDVRDDVAGLTDFGHVRDGDLETINQPLDMLGVNYYNPFITAGPDGTESAPSSTAAPVEEPLPSPFPASSDVRFLPLDSDTTAMGWPIDASGLVSVLRRVHRDYPELPLYVTENGAAFPDGPGDDGAVHDARRTRFLAQHLEACAQVAAEGVPVHGYFHWSLLDNFELAWGYSQRFGLVYVDYASQRRILKDSARWYADFIARHRTAPTGGTEDR